MTVVTMLELLLGRVTVGISFFFENESCAGHRGSKLGYTYQSKTLVEGNIKRNCGLKLRGSISVIKSVVVNNQNYRRNAMVNINVDAQRRFGKRPLHGMSLFKHRSNL